MKKVKSILKSPLLIVITFVLPLFITCEDSRQDIFPELDHDGPYIENSIYFGHGEYIEYHSGSLPIILSAPHGGWLDPTEIPDRTQGITEIDTNTYQLTKTIMDTLAARFGGKPHVILCLLKRLKLDVNREELEAAE